jgi:hypothetical protein
MEKLSKILGRNAQLIAKQTQKANRGLYKLTPKDVSNIEVALRLRIESCEDNEDWKSAAAWKRTWRKFT